MAKVTFGEYSAFTSKNNQVRFAKDGKMTSETALPPEVVVYLKNKLEPKFPMPTEEEKKRMREESLKVAPELQVAPEKLVEDVIKAEEQIPEEVPHAPEPGERLPSEVNSINTSALGDPIAREVVDSDFLESVSIHTASVQDIAEALYNRFGVYTVYLNELPNMDEINPLTGEIFTKYHLGIAYQAAISAKNRGILEIPAEEGRKSLDAGRAAHENFQVDTPPQTMGEARQAGSFAYRTSVRATRPTATTVVTHEVDEKGRLRAVKHEITEDEQHKNGARDRFSPEDDQMIVEPSFGKQVIRPNW